MDHGSGLPPIRGNARADSSINPWRAGVAARLFCIKCNGVCMHRGAIAFIVATHASGPDDGFCSARRCASPALSLFPRAPRPPSCRPLNRDFAGDQRQFASPRCARQSIDFPNNFPSVRGISPYRETIAYITFSSSWIFGRMEFKVVSLFYFLFEIFELFVEIDRIFWRKLILI